MTATGKKLPNICWLIPDSIRSIPALDMIGRLRFMDKFALSAVEYTRMYTAAPSTMMSATSYFSGMPATAHTDSYQTLKNHRLGIPTIYSELKDLGYHLYFFSFYPHVREAHSAFCELEQHIENREAFEEIYFHADGGDSVKEFVESFLKNQKLKEPFCFFYHAFVSYGLFRHDYDFSADMERVYNALLPNLPPENSIALIHSDHGYPVYRGEENKDFMWQHDLLMTEENIRVPFFIRYPGCAAGTAISTPATLMDVYPTIMDILGKKPKNPLLQGESILPGRFPQNTRRIRVDNRLHGQGGHKAAFITGDRKLVVDYETSSASLWRVGDHCVEQEEQNPPESLVKSFITQFEESERLCAQARNAVVSLSRDQGIADLQKFLASESTPVALIVSASLETINAVAAPLRSLPFSQVIAASDNAKCVLPMVWPNAVRIEDISEAGRGSLRVAICVDSLTNIQDSVLESIEIARSFAVEPFFIFDHLMSGELVHDAASYQVRKRMVANARKQRDARRDGSKPQLKEDYFRRLEESYKRRSF